MPNLYPHVTDMSQARHDPCYRYVTSISQTFYKHVTSMLQLPDGTLELCSNSPNTTSRYWLTLASSGRCGHRALTYRLLAPDPSATPTHCSTRPPELTTAASSSVLSSTFAPVRYIRAPLHPGAVLPKGWIAVVTWQTNGIHSHG